MNEESDSCLTKENYRGASEPSDFDEYRSRPGFFSNDQSINFASNPFEEEYSSTSFALKKMKFTKDVSESTDKEKKNSIEKIFTDPESSKSSAIDALEQFKCQVRSRQKFTNPLGTPRVSAPKIYNTEISQLLTVNKKEEKPKTRLRKKKEAEPPLVEIPKEYSVGFGQNDMMETEESQRSPEQEGKMSSGKGSKSKTESSDFEEKIPDWAIKENARDANGRSQDDPDYDPHTLWIPPKALDGCTPLVRKYWEIKSQHFDEILLFQVGEFYRISYDDALICHRELNLNWLGNKMVVGVHWRSFDKCVEVLILKGYKVCVVEQSENYKGKKTRLKDSSHENKEKTIKRDVSQVLSKGTFIDYNNPNYEPRYLLSLRINNKKVAVTFLEIGYSVMTFGYFDDDESFTSLKTLISQIKPTEVVYDRTSIDHNIIRYLRYLPGGPVLTASPQIKGWSSLKLADELEKYYGASADWPQALQEIVSIENSQREMLLLSFIGILEYLEKALISDQVLYTARYELYDPEAFKQSKMILDSQALSNLEVFEVNYGMKSSFEGSLLSYIDKTVTKYGKRLLKNWICGPLLDVKVINQRLDAIEDLELNWEMREKIKFQLKKLPDFERLCGKIYSSSIKKAEGVILFEDVTIQRLQEFRKLLESFETARNLIVEMNDVNWNSELLKTVFTLEDYNKVNDSKSSSIPDVLPILQELSNFIVWEGINKDVPTPRIGVDREYDKVRDEINWIGQEFEKYLQEIKARFKSHPSHYAISYVHIKERYEIEIPSELVSGSKKPDDFEISSKKKGYERFVTEKIRQLRSKLEDAEERLQALLKLFVCFVFRYFYTYNKVWDCFIKGLAQLDCLCSLSTVSFSSDSDMCRPEVSPLGERTFLEVRSMRHPCIAALKPNFVPNDILIGDTENNGENKNVILLTGPNMGGKSTILRQACIAAILAQIGCYVPAKLCKLSIVDRIFTRIGAFDRLIEGKSTFSIEMEETLNILRYGTKNSLAILDELGRGTTTFDGISIAYSVLKFIIQKLQLRTLFATHYHLLLDEFRNSPCIKFNYMDYRVDTVNERILFLYTLVEGECAKSFGLNISKIAGIDQEVVEKARLKAEEFDKEFHLKQNETKEINKKFGNIINLLNVKGEDSEIEEDFDYLFNTLSKM